MSAGTTAAPSLRRVLDAFAAGARTVDDLADHAGLDADLVRVALDQLVTLGLVASSPMSAGTCPPSGCASCPAGAQDCSRPARGSLVTLTLAARP